MTDSIKAPKITLASLLFAAAPVLRELADGETHSKEELAEHKTAYAEFVDTQSLAVANYLNNKLVDTSVVTAIFKAVPKKLESIKAEADRLATEKANAEAAAAAKAKAERDEFINTLTKQLTDSGMDIEVVQAMVQTGIAKKYGEPKADKKVSERTIVVVDGVEYEIPERGNLSPAVKEVMQKHGFEGNRKGFVEKFAKVTA